MTKQSKRLTARPVSEACIRPCFGLQAALFVTVMTGNHCANNQKDPYVSTAHIPVELTLYGLARYNYYYHIMRYGRDPRHPRLRGHHGVQQNPYECRKTGRGPMGPRPRGGSG